VSWTIRSATPADVEAVHALVESAYRGDSSRAGWTTEADLLDGQRTDVDAVRAAVPDLLVALDADLVGCCVASLDGTLGYFGMFAVSPTLQGGGIGGALLAAAEQSVRERGGHEMEMTVISVREELISYYERRGYERTGEVRPFPHGDARFGLPRRPDLEFAVLRKAL
jgi:ribosomal protein S18 acetylase RimI-like enzyme